MRKSKAFVFLLTMVVAVAFSLGGSLAAGAEGFDWSPHVDNRQFTIGSGAPGSLFVNYMVALSEILNRHVPNMSAFVEPGGASQNLIMVHDREVDFGITPTLLNFWGVHGLNWADGVKFDNVKAWFPAYSTSGVWVVGANSGIYTLSDLQGRNVSLGMAGSGSDIDGRIILNLFGIEPNITNNTWPDVGGQMQDGLLDAFYHIAGHPAAFITELELNMDLRVLIISDEEIATIQREYPHFGFRILEPGIYRFLTEPIKVTSGWNIIVINPDLDEDFVYELTRVVWENVEIIHAAAASFIETQLENVRFMNMEPHPGAARFYRERGIELPTVPPPPAN